METSLLAATVSRGRGIPEMPPVQVPTEALMAFPVEADGAFAAVLMETAKDRQPVAEIPRSANAGLARDAGTIRSPRPARGPAVKQPPADESPKTDSVPAENEASPEPVRRMSAVTEETDPPEQAKGAAGPDTHPIVPLVCAEIPQPRVVPVDREAEPPPPPIAPVDAASAIETAPASPQESTSFELNLGIKASPLDSAPASHPEAEGSSDILPEPAVESTGADPIAHEEIPVAVAADPVPSPPLVNMSTLTPLLMTRNAPSHPVTEPAVPASRPGFEVAAPRELHANTGAVQRIGLVFREADRFVRIDIRQGSEGVRVAVRTPDMGMTQHLREGLPELIGRLDAQGFDPKLMDSPQQRSQPQRDAPRDHPRQRRRQSAWDPDHNQ